MASAEDGGAKRPEIIVAPGAGFCFGVRRAVARAEELLAEGGRRVVSLGPLMHCPQEVARLEGEGMAPITADQIAPGDAVLVRTHGVPLPQLVELGALADGAMVHNATCPHVRSCQTIASRMAAEGYGVLLVGHEGHQEIDSVVSFAVERADEGSRRSGRPVPVLVVSEAAHLDQPALDEVRRVAVLCQTTMTQDRYRAVVAAALDRFVEVRAFDTICGATGRRQREAARLAREVDVVVVVGGRNSANTRRLAETCAGINRCTFHVETADELEQGWFEGAARVAVTAGASTPGWLVEQVVRRLEEL